MNTKHLLLTGLCALTLGGLTGCETIAVADNNGPGPGDYEYRGPARVTALSNGNYLARMGSRTAAFGPNGRLISGAGLTSAEIAHAQQAVRYYINGHRGDYYHPNYAPPSYTPPTWRPDGPDYSRPDPGYGRSPEVRPRGDGMIEVLMPRGGVVLYDRNGRLVQKGGTVSGSELNDANSAVQSHLREQTSSRGYDGV